MDVFFMRCCLSEPILKKSALKNALLFPNTWIVTINKKDTFSCPPKEFKEIHSIHQLRGLQQVGIQFICDA